MIVTTTNSIEGSEISRYNDPIAANVVIGTNVFSDIGAGYVDFIGVRSTSCLGYMNLIRIIFEIEILVQEFKRNKDRKLIDINLLIIEKALMNLHNPISQSNIQAIIYHRIRSLCFISQGCSLTVFNL